MCKSNYIKVYIYLSTDIFYILRFRSDHSLCFIWQWCKCFYFLDFARNYLFVIQCCSIFLQRTFR